MLYDMKGFQGTYFDMAILRDDFEAVEVGSHLRNVVDDRCDSKYCWVASIVLEIVKC